MLRISRIASLVAGTAVVGVLAAGSPAMAATSYDVDQVSCVFAGLAGNLTPGVYSVSHTLTAALGGQLPPDSGSFSFTTDGAPLPTVCALVSSNLNEDGSDSDTEVGIATAKIVATGGYSNFVCGTGTASGTSTISATSILAGAPSNPDGDDLSATANFTIAFAGGNGALAITNAKDGGGDSGNLPAIGGGGAGYVNIVPDATAAGGGDCVLNDVHQFRVTGAFTAAIPRVSAT
jgi:hypothetical protein